MSYTYNPVTSADMAQNIVSSFSSVPLKSLSPVFIAGNVINRTFEDTVGATVGEYINIPLPTTGLQVNDMGESGIITEQQGNNGTVQLALINHKEVSFSIPTITSTYINWDASLQYLEAAMIALASKCEGDIMNLYTGYTFNTPVGAANTPITTGTLIAARESLVNALVPSYEQKTLIVSPAAYAGLLANAGLTSQYQVGGDGTPIVNGMLGERFGMSIVESQLVPVTGSGATLTSHNVLMARDAAAMVCRRLPVANPALGTAQTIINNQSFSARLSWSYNATGLADRWTLDTLYAVSVLRPQFATVVLS